MSKNSRKYTGRMDKTSFDPDTKIRGRKDLRSTERPFKDVNEEISSGHRGSIDKDKS